MKLIRKLLRTLRHADRKLVSLRDEVKFTRALLDRTVYEGKIKLLGMQSELDTLHAEIVQARLRLIDIEAGSLNTDGETGQLQGELPSEVVEPVAAPVIGRIGELLLGKGLINEAQLSEAMEQQRVYGGRLGDILVELEYIGIEVLTEVLQSIPRKARLGDLLIQNGLLTVDELNQALEFQKNSGGALGDILTSLRLIEPEQLYRALATQSDMGRIGENFALEDVVKLPEEFARQLNVVVVGERASRYLVAVGVLLPPEQIIQVEDILGRAIEQVLATPEEMEYFWKSIYEVELMDKSIRSLMMEQPENSAHVTFTKPQLITTAAMTLILIICFFVNWLVTFIVLNVAVQIFYFVMTIFKFSIIMMGTREHAQLRYSPEQIAAVDERDLPIYTILVPMYKESKVIPHLVGNLEKLDYPKAKLDVRLLIEEDDIEAQEMLKSMQLPAYYTTLVVPDSLPKTKPKACNYGLIRARGEYVVIYDAEDRPDPDQLKKVYLAFKSSPDNLVCVQAKLNYFNSEQNILTRWFTQEYSMWFELLLPGVMQLDIPIPLGGTSNHFKMEALKQINAWDPYNVTEDADLGIRLYKEGFKSAIVDSRTWEEANSRFGNWVRQRSRWIKGYMQTWLVHMRNPFRLWKDLGFKGFMGFQVMVLATPVLPLLNPFYWLLVVVWYTTSAGFIPVMFPGMVYYMAAFGLFIGNFLFVFSNVAGMYWAIEDMEKKGKQYFSYSIVKYALLTPIYWIMMSIAAIKAAWQLITKPFYWEKTNHGLSEGHIDSMDIDHSA